jgi:hypothetical protein
MGQLAKKFVSNAVDEKEMGLYWLFHCNSDTANSSECYVVGTLHVLLFINHIFVLAETG